MSNLPATQTASLTQAKNSNQMQVQSREFAQVQSRLVYAASPQAGRDISEVKSIMLEECKDTQFAEVSLYSYPKGGAQIEGPSIRMAEMMARYWGHLDFGFNVLNSDEKHSEVEAYCFDLRSNVRRAASFTVSHFRSTKSGGYWLTDPRDIYEMVSNQAQRRVRACILALMPSSIVNSCHAQANETIKNGGGETLEQRINNMIRAYAALGIAREHLDSFVGGNVEKASPTQITQLRKSYAAIKDGFAKPEQVFASMRPSDDDANDDASKDTSKLDNLEKTIGDQPPQEKPKQENPKAKKPAKKKPGPKRANEEPQQANQEAATSNAQKANPQPNSETEKQQTFSQPENSQPIVEIEAVTVDNNPQEEGSLFSDMSDLDSVNADFDLDDLDDLDDLGDLS